MTTISALEEVPLQVLRPVLVQEVCVNILRIVVTERDDTALEIKGFDL